MKSNIDNDILNKRACVYPETAIDPDRFKVPDPFENEFIRPIIPLEIEDIVIIKEVCTEDNDLREINISDLSGNDYAIAHQYNNNSVNIKFMSGKFGKTSAVIEPRDEEFKHLKILAIEDSYLYTQNNFMVKVYGKYINKDSTDKSFITAYKDLKHFNKRTIKITDKKNHAGVKLLLTTSKSCYPESVENAITGYFNDGFYDEISMDGEFAGDFKNDYAIFIPAAGKGTRLGDATWTIGNVGKPAMPLPARIKDQDYLLIQDTLTNLTRAGLLGNNVSIEIIREDIPRGSASGLIKALTTDHDFIKRPLIVRQSDAFSDIDFSRIIKEFEEKNAGVMIVGYPVGVKLLNAVGIIGTNENMEVTGFLEKPGLPENAVHGLIKGIDKYKDMYLGSIGMYVFSSAALKWIKAKVLHESENFFRGEGGLYDFANDIFPKLVEACNKGAVIDENGIPLKMFAAVAECNWSDFGFTSEYLNELRKAAAIDSTQGGYDIPDNIRKQFRQNIDLESGIVCLRGSRAAFDKFCSKYKIEAYGNILVTTGTI